MAMTRRAFLHTVGRTIAATGVALALPLVRVLQTPALAACEVDGAAAEDCKPEGNVLRPAGPPGVRAVVGLHLPEHEALAER